jgi:hypothetical protein
MLQQLADFVTPITDPFAQMQGHFMQLSTSLQTMNTRLRSQSQTLTTGSGNEGFQGLGAQAFSAAITYYIGISNQHAAVLEQAAGAIQTCNTQLLNAVGVASASNPNVIIVNYVLDRVTLNEVVEQGSTPVEIVLQQLRQTLNDMVQRARAYGNDLAKAGQDFGHAFVDFFSGHFSAAGHDLEQSGSAFLQSWGDLGQFLLDTGEVVWESVFELTAAALIQCAQEIWQAVKTCANKISSLVAKAVQDIKGLETTASQIVRDDPTYMNDVRTKDFSGAINIILQDIINPELKKDGLQPLSASQIEEIIKQQSPGLWQWIQSHPWYVVAIVLVTIVIAVVGTMVVRMFQIQSALSAKGITASKGQIWSLLWQGYSNQQIEYILTVASVHDSQGVTFGKPSKKGKLPSGHGENHIIGVGTSDSAMQQRVGNGHGHPPADTAFPDATTAQQAANYAIAHSSVLQNFIDTGAPDLTVWDTVDIPRSIGKNCYGYVYDPTLPWPHARKIGPPLLRVRIGLFKDASGRVYIFDIYPVQ